jgi:uncharacterized repeat protein (TIGR02543 family)
VLCCASPEGTDVRARRRIPVRGHPRGIVTREKIAAGQCRFGIKGELQVKSILASAPGLAPKARLISFALIVATTTLFGGTVQAASGTYLFRDTLTPIEGAGNTLVPTFNNGPFVNGTFVDTTIDANVCPGTPTVRGWSFPQFGGLMTANDAPAVVGGSYTISMIVKFSPMIPGYSRLIDFSNSTLDTGIYELNGGLSLYPVGTFAPGSFVNDRFSFVTFTRDAATNVVSVFVGTTPAGTYVDTGGLYVPSAQNVIFLMDNTTGAANISESSPGVITYLKLIDAPVTASDISTLQDQACSTVVTPSYAVTVSSNPPAGGTAVCTPNPVLSGSSSACTATPNSGYTFTGWTGDCSGATCNLAGVTAAESVTANFAPSGGPTTVQQIPTLSKMGTWLLAGLLVLFAATLLRRRNAKD